MLSRRIASRLRDMETPFYLYDTELLRQTLESVVNESKRSNYKVHYAIKANYDDRLLAIIREYGLGVDCASGNEVQKAIEAGFDPKSIVYAGVGKRDKELRYAIEQEIMAINCESIEELLVLDAMAAEAGRTVEVALRVNPDIDPKTNHCIDTGQADSKFGISYEEILDNAERIRSLKHLRIVGVHLHIGSQIRELHVFENMCQKVNVIVENLERLGFSFRFVDVGGGLGINYDMPENEPIPNFASLFAIVHNHLRVGDREVHFEFGRSIVGECGELITRVLFNKTTATGRKLLIARRTAQGRRVEPSPAAGRREDRRQEQQRRKEGIEQQHRQHGIVAQRLLLRHVVQSQQQRRGKSQQQPHGAATSGLRRRRRRAGRGGCSATPSTCRRHRPT